MPTKDDYRLEASSVPPPQKKLILRRHIPFLLPVRGASFGARVLRLLRVWLWQGWQAWRTRQLIIQPPLQPPRQNPFPRRPHQARRQAVFAALATAPPQATIKELIAHVRTVTGLGCSRKLIVEWRQKSSGGEGETGRQRDSGRARKTGKRRRLIQQRLFLLYLVICFAVGGWQASLKVGAQEIIVSPAPNDSPPISNLPSQISPSIGPRSLRIRLTLQSTRELCVKQGDEVKAGDLLSDRAPARQRLWLQRRALQTATHHLQTQMKLTAASLRQLST